ncbi:HNH endonuclease signature motif containing protein [Streptomyces turgidiscabies]|uniref:HNH endonuclease signature motif containing protein n=1 Tax=Streptomyces turgidiscabies TaxID=85558 RepID=UPI0038F5EBCA
MARLLAKVAPRDVHGCTLWDASTGNRGYGQFWLNGRMVGPHRVAWEYHHGPVPEGLELDHKFSAGCRSILCVNIEHLELATHAENVRRWHAARRWMAGIWVRTELDEG